MDILDAALAPYTIETTATMSGWNSGDVIRNNTNDQQQPQPQPQQQQQLVLSSPQISMTFDMEAIQRIDYIRDKLMAVEVGGSRPLARQVIASVVDEIEKDARVARLLPPLSSPCDIIKEQNSDTNDGGWAWSWKYDDWFRWRTDEGRWVSAAQAELKVAYLI